MIPTTFNGCFGWLHPGYGPTGVVLCAAFGHENMTAHYGWRKLAEKLASRGYHVLRFDYIGTGDSVGTEEDPGQLERWKESVVSATRHLISISGSQEVILVGLRLGATLALLASKDIPEVNGVACLAPAIVGRTYVRELRLRANGWREANLYSVNDKEDKYLDVLGERLSGTTIYDLSKIDLRVFKSKPKHILVMCPQQDPAVLVLVENLQSQNCQVFVESFAGYAEYLEDSIASVVPDEAFDKIADWCFQSSSLSKLSDHICDDQSVSSNQAAMTISNKIDFVERAVNFRAVENIYGILCVPYQPHDDDRVVIMLNTGFSRHTGDGRVFTMLARRLAQLGIASLRMDLAGFGDSEIGDHEINPYAARSSADVGAALTFLEELGYHKPVLVGVCSGAFNAFHAALHDTRVRGLVMVNTQHFVWKAGSSLKVENKRQRRPLNFYTKAIGRPYVWRRLIHGEVAIGSILIALCKRPWTSTFNKLMLLLENTTGIQTSIGQVNRWFTSLTSRGVRIKLLYSSSDPGLEKLSLHLGKRGEALKEFSGVCVDVIKDADHALFDHSARRHFIDMVTRFMERSAL